MAQYSVFKTRFVVNKGADSVSMSVYLLLFPFQKALMKQIDNTLNQGQ